MDISSSIKYIVHDRPDVLPDSKSFIALLSDLSYDHPAELLIYRIHINDRFLSCFGNETNNIKCLCKAKMQLEMQGLSKENVYSVLQCFANALGWIEDLSQVYPASHSTLPSSQAHKRIMGPAKSIISPGDIGGITSIKSTLQDKQAICNAASRLIAITANHIFGVKRDGTVLVSQRYSIKIDSITANVSSWKNIISIAATNKTVVGLQSDGNVVIVEKTGESTYEHAIKGEKLIAVAAYDRNVLGLKSNGKVVDCSPPLHETTKATKKTSAVDNGLKPIVQKWKDIIDIKAGLNHFVGIMANNTIITSRKEDDYANINNIIAVSAMGIESLCLRTDGSVVHVGKHPPEEICNERCVGIGSSIYAAFYGIQEDGSVVQRYGKKEVSTWRDIIAIAGEYGEVVGLKSDGTVLSIQHHDLSSWKLF